MMGCDIIYDMESFGWRMTKRYTFLHNALFKVKQIDDDTLMLHMPRAKRINFYDMQLSPLPIAIEFQHEMQAIEYFRVGERDLVFAGLKNGIIQAKQYNFDEGGEGKMELRLEQELGNDIYINDMLYLEEGRMANCFNSGNIAIWDVSQMTNQTQPVAYLKKIHRDFTYKLRRVDRQRMVSCGNDQYANIIDLQTAQVTDSFHHSGPVWCTYPLNQNLLCSTGLMGCLYFTDIRCGGIVNVVQLLTTETSFVTGLDHNNLVFGDRRQVSRCDLRMSERIEHCPKGMKVSVEAIVVTDNGGVAVGRGGDMCLFEKGGEQQQVEEQSMRPDNTEVSMPQSHSNQGFLALLLQNLQQNMHQNINIINASDSSEQEQEEQLEQQQQQQQEQQEQFNDEENQSDDQPA